MPKRREPQNNLATPSTLSHEQVEAFAAGAEQVSSQPQLDPNANRDYKGIRVGLNEYEYRILEEASRRTGRSKLNYIRYAILSMAKQLDDD